MHKSIYYVCMTTYNMDCITKENICKCTFQLLPGISNSFLNYWKNNKIMFSFNFFQFQVCKYTKRSCFLKSSLWFNF